MMEFLFTDFPHCELKCSIQYIFDCDDKVAILLPILTSFLSNQSLYFYGWHKILCRPSTRGSHNVHKNLKVAKRTLSKLT